MNNFNVGDKVRVTLPLSYNYEKVGIITSITICGITVASIEDDTFRNSNGIYVKEVLFDNHKIHWLSLDVDDTNVIKMSAWCKKEMNKELEVKEKASLTLEEIARKNRENQERLKKERAKDNSNVTRSYRLKK